MCYFQIRYDGYASLVLYQLSNTQVSDLFKIGILLKSKVFKFPKAQIEETKNQFEQERPKSLESMVNDVERRQNVFDHEQISNVNELSFEYLLNSYFCF